MEAEQVNFKASLAARSIACAESYLASCTCPKPEYAAYPAFLRALYTELRNDPFYWGIPWEAYERYMQRKQARQTETPLTPEKHHQADSTESALRNAIQCRITFIPAFLCEAGLVGSFAPGNGELFVPEAALNRILEEVEGAQLRGQGLELLHKLNVLGIEVEQEAEGLHLISHREASLFAGLRALCAVPETSFRRINILRADFEGLAKSTAMPTDERVASCLPQRDREVLELFLRSLQGNTALPRLTRKVRPPRMLSSDGKWKVDFSCKQKAVAGYYASPNGVLLTVYFNSYQNINALAAALAQRDRALLEDLKTYLPERQCRCPNNRRVLLDGEYRRICGLANRAECFSPTPEQAQALLKLLVAYRAPDAEEKV